jgi:hypothetical protein
MKQKLNRTTFKTSREMDFFSQKELVTQTGHEIGEWPFVIVKELVDNATDACEEAGIPPVVTITADASSITIADNGPGLPESTLAAALDFTIRASSREGYVSPSRGAQGNALMTLFPMPRVVDPSTGRMIVEASGKRHVITVRADPISQRAVVHDDVAEIPKSKKSHLGVSKIKLALSSGTSIRMEWSAMAEEDGIIRWPFGGLAVHGKACAGSFVRRFRDLCMGFAMFNPHLTLHIDWFGKKQTFKATNPQWTKWLPSDPTSVHWYELQHLERLIAAYITHDRDTGQDRLVSDFLREFDGLSGSAKRNKVLTDAGMKRTKLSELVVVGHLDSGRIAVLLDAMKRHTRPVASRRLGVIGEDHLRKFFVDGLGCKLESFRYSRRTAEQKVKNLVSGDGDKACFIPWCMESAFGYLGGEDDGADDERRRIFTGANFSASIKNPFRSFGGTGEGLEAALNKLYVGAEEPIVFGLHLAHPRVEYTDRGKSSIIVEG